MQKEPQGLLLLGFIVLHLIHASNALECYACDSAEDVECATRPGQQLEVEECTQPNDECIISITAGLTRRGCLKRLYPNGFCPNLCHRCNTSLCNRHVFPEDRLRCYQCGGETCIDVSKTPQLLRPCPIYREDDRCYTNIMHLGNTQRGCEHTNLPSSCPHVCLKCNYNGCNSEKTIIESHCLKCSHSNLTPNADCQRDQHPNLEEQCALNNATVHHCFNRVMLGHRERCFTHRNKGTGTLERGCSTTRAYYPTGELFECYGDNCNGKCEDIACATCNSTSDANCRQGQIWDTQQCAPGTTSCYSCEQDTLLRRGCADANFVAGAGEACQLCRSGNGCNRGSVRSCYRCNSEEQDEDCSTMLRPNDMKVSKCATPTELCVSTVISRLQMVYTVRGCAGEVPECSLNDPYCVRCNGSLCNSAPTMWSTTRLQTLVAAGDGDKQKEQSLLGYLQPDF